MNDSLVKLYNILNGDGYINKYVRLINNGAINIAVTFDSNYIMFNFTDPEPTINITEFITIKDNIDYFRITNEGQVLVKTRHWPQEIRVDGHM